MFNLSKFQRNKTNENEAGWEKLNEFCHNRSIINESFFNDDANIDEEDAKRSRPLKKSRFERECELYEVCTLEKYLFCWFFKVYKLKSPQKHYFK